MVNEWTADDLPTKFDDSRFPRHQWNPSHYLMADLAVWLNEHHPKPAREVTRQDLPSVDEAAETYMTKGVFSVQEGIALVLDAVVAHLNANGGLPAADDRWRRAHAIVEQERDQARSERDEAVARADDYDSTYELWRRAHALAEQERDRAICERHEAVRDRDLWEGKYLDADEAKQVGRSLLVAADDARQRIMALGATTS